MTWKRCWKSCAEPQGAAKFGPLADIAMGTAIIWFYDLSSLEKTPKPCGRILLFPQEIKGKKALCMSSRIYGKGPGNLEKLRQQITSQTNLPIIEGSRICSPYQSDDFKGIEGPKSLEETSPETKKELCLVWNNTKNETT